jgi:hypothetical protein
MGHSRSEERRAKARNLAGKARRVTCSDDTLVEAIQALANAIDLLADDCEQLEATGNARVRE